MLTDDAGRASSRQGSHPTDVSDAEWQRIAPLLSQISWTGRRRKYDIRTIVNAILYVQRTGKSWRQLPPDLPPWQSVYRYLRRWQEDGSWQRVQDALERSSQPLVAASSVQQYVLRDNDGRTWVRIDDALTLLLTPPAAGPVWLHGYANLLTTHHNLGKQLGIRIAGGAFGSGVVVAWQESGGTVLAPVSVQATAQLAAAATYTVELVWKSARAMIGDEQITAGAGGQAPHSPCGLIALLSPPASAAR